MSILSNLTGIGISKKGIKINPLKALGTVATLGSFGALGPVAAGLGRIPMVGGALAKGAGALKGAGMPGGLKKVGKFALNNPDLLLGAASAYGGYKSGQQADKLRDTAMSDLGSAARPDLSSVYGGYSNAYTPQRRITRVGSRY